jgi:hypothetical protein
MSDRCPMCKALEVENAMLKNEIIQLKNEVARLKRIIAAARNRAAAIMMQARQVMSDHCPRGTWSLFKGRAGAASEVDSQLGG